jgi:hypothetical protein
MQKVTIRDSCYDGVTVKGKLSMSTVCLSQQRAGRPASRGTAQAFYLRLLLRSESLSQHYGSSVSKNCAAISYSSQDPRKNDN